MENLRHIYGYVRKSTLRQSLDKQIENILNEYPTAEIFNESYTGTKVYERKEFNKLLKTVKKYDTIVFDSINRMSRNADEGVIIYMDLYNKGIRLVFLKERYLDTDTYISALSNSTQTTDDYLKCINETLKQLIAKQIQLSFEQSQKESKELHQRMKEGIQAAREDGKQIGQAQGKKLHIKKKAPAMEQIKKYSKDFYGTLKDNEVMKKIGISRNTYYKYKSELAEQEILRVMKNAYESQDKKCAICGKKFDFEDMSRDYITSLRKEGKSNLYNFQMLCRDCNAKKRDK